MQRVISRFIAVCLAVAMMAAGHVGLAQTPRKAPVDSASRNQQDPCANPTTQLALTECAGSTFTKSDAILTQTYNALLADLDDQNRPLLRTAQRAWIAYRDAECALQGSHALGGSMYPQMVLICKEEMTGARSKELVALRRTLSERLR